MPTHPAALPADLAALADRLPAPLLALAARDGRTLSLERGARLFVAGAAVRGLHLVVTGGVRVVRESVERAVVVHHEGPGGLLGEVALFTDGVYPGSAVATEPTALRLVPADAVRRALAAEPAIAELLLRRLARRTREVIERLDRVAHLTVVRRVALHLLARAATSARGRAAGPPVVSLGMTQTALAEELGTVKPIVVRELGTLRRLGLVEAVGAGRGVRRDGDADRRAQAALGVARRRVAAGRRARARRVRRVAGAAQRRDARGPSKASSTSTPAKMMSEGKNSAFVPVSHQPHGSSTERHTPSSVSPVTAASAG